jgi:hypothetical protein
MRVFGRSRVALAGALGAALVASCSGAEEIQQPTGGGPATGTGGDASGSGGDGGAFVPTGSGGNGGGAGQDDPGECAKEVFAADPVKLDIVVMLDVSGSMNEDSGQPGTTKWQAVSQALETFFTDPTVADVGVGLQFFPQNLPGVPASCSSHAECGAAGPCAITTCDNSSVVDACASDAECGGGDCVPLGECLFGGGLCAPAVAGVYCDFFGLDPCIPLGSATCENPTSCDAADYGLLEVPIGDLALNAPVLGAALDARVPEGWTPTAAALEGGLAQAADWAAAHPDRATVVVIATDGVPTRCDPMDAAGLSALAEDGVLASPSVSTFVIGVIAPGDAAAASLLDEVALAGGTAAAQLVDPLSSTLSADFVAALEEIQKSALACEFALPTPDGMPIADFGKVNVEYKKYATLPVTLPYVGDLASCDPTTGGWYYDVDPASGDPSKILVCPSTCAEFKHDGGEVTIVVGCDTETEVPR